jgi:hypothetical protein
MATIEEQQQWRDDYLVALYEISGRGNLLTWGTHQQIAEASGIPLDEIMNVGQLLSAQGVVKFMTMAGLAGSVAITAPGVLRAEKIIQGPGTE